MLATYGADYSIFHYVKTLIGFRETKHAERRATVRWADVWGPLLPGICPVTREKLPEETGAPRATRPPGHRTRTLTSPHPSLRCASFRSLGRGRGVHFSLGSSSLLDEGSESPPQSCSKHNAGRGPATRCGASREHFSGFS